jgi:tRNA(fMet)-specific endonuclease VapC
VREEPRLLLDTNILVHLVRRDAVGQRVENQFQLLTIAPRPLVSSVSHGELRALAAQFGWGAARAEEVDRLLRYFDEAPNNSPGIPEAYALIAFYCRSQGRVLSDNDVWIAATAHVLDLRLLTADRDFDFLHGVFLSREWINPQQDHGA